MLIEFEAVKELRRVSGGNSMVSASERSSFPVVFSWL